MATGEKVEGGDFVAPCGSVQIEPRQIKITSEVMPGHGGWAAAVAIPSAGGRKVYLRQLTAAHVGRDTPIAGQSMIWPAAVRLTDQLLERHAPLLQAGARVIELGCGLAMPGMICAALGANVLLTDVPEVVPFAEQRIVDNFSKEGSTTGSARVAALVWDVEAAKSLLKEEGGFDMIICSDGVYAPLYGRASCAALAEVIRCLSGPSTVSVISICRRPPQHPDDPFSDDGTAVFYETLAEKLEFRRLETQPIMLGNSRTVLEVIEARLPACSSKRKECQEDSAVPDAKRHNSTKI